MTTKEIIKNFLVGDPKEIGTQKFNSEEVLLILDSASKRAALRREGSSPYARVVGLVLGPKKRMNSRKAVTSRRRRPKRSIKKNCIAS